MRETLYRQVDAEYALQREKNMLEQEARQAQAEAADPMRRISPPSTASCASGS